MEKPPPTYDHFARYTSRTTEDSARYEDRLVLRGVPRLKDSEEETNGPSWRGDHSFSSDAASYSLTHFIEPEIQKAHPDWSVAEVKKLLRKHLNSASNRIYRTSTKRLSMKSLRYDGKKSKQKAVHGNLLPHTATR